MDYYKFIGMIILIELSQAARNKSFGEVFISRESQNSIYFLYSIF